MKIKTNILALLVCALFTLPMFAQAQSQANYNPADSTGFIKLTEGTIVKVIGLYMIVPNNNEGRRFNPSNLDPQFHKEGMQVRFSAVQLVIPPNVRLAGSPVHLKTIEAITPGSSKATGTKPRPSRGNLKPGAGPNRPVQKNNPTVNSTPISKPAIRPVAEKSMIEGTVSYMAGVYVINAVDGQRYVPTNLPTGYQRTGMKIRVNGVALPIPPNVKMVGVPYEIKTIQRLTDFKGIRN